MKGGSCGSCGRRSAQRNAGRRSSWAAGCGEPSTVLAAQPVGSPEPRLVRSPTTPSAAAVVRRRNALLGGVDLPDCPA